MQAATIWKEMAVSKLPVATLLISLLGLIILHHAEAALVENTTSEATGHFQDQKIDCRTACLARCQLSSRQRLCNRACGTCCARCNCVPPGTSGNQDACPCYATLTTHGGRRKCP